MGNRRLLWACCATAWLAACGGDSTRTSSESPAQQPAAAPAGGAGAAGTVASGGAGQAAGRSSANVGGAGAGAAAPSAEAGATAASAGSQSSANAAGGGGSDAAGAAGADAAMGDVPSDATDPSPGCADSKLMPGDSMLTLQSGGAARVYVQHIPPGYDGKTPLPVVLDLHGGSYDGPRWVDASGFKKLGDTENFITLFPSGTDNSWLATEAQSADGDFLKELIAEVGKQGCIDRKRIYATGCSMGGAMSFWMGCFASELIAAIAPMCGTPFFELADCKPKRPFSMMLVMGETDNLNCWDGMPSGIGNPCVMQVFEHFKGLNMCSGEAKDLLDGVCHTYDTCGQDASATEVTVCKSNTGHGVYQATNMEVTNESWKFLKRFHLP